jgi:cytochrome c biogenesis protein CcmG/thiol:disulfide interchange protein DsbE
LGAKNFAVVGVSLDDKGWKVVQPFLAAHRVPYRMVVGDETLAKRYGVVGQMPNTLLIHQTRTSR